MPIEQWQMRLGDLLISIKSSRWLRALQAIANRYGYCAVQEWLAQEQNSIGGMSGEAAALAADVGRQPTTSRTAVASLGPRSVCLMKRLHP
jgi:hypothetical protein